MEKLDRRVVRTRRLLRDSLMELILEQGYDAITVQDITERANLGRGTFYLHYQDKADLLEKSLVSIYEDLLSYLEPFSLEDSLSDPRPIIRAFEYAGENKELFLVILNEASETVFREFRHTMTKHTAVQIKNRLKDDTLPVSLLANHLISSLLTLIAWWLENEMPYPAEKMVNIFHQLTYSGLGQFIALE